MNHTSPLTVFCPRCGARPGEPCMGMEPLSYHAMRRVIAHNAESEARAAAQIQHCAGDVQAVTDKRGT